MRYRLCIWRGLATALSALILLRATQIYLRISSLPQNWHFTLGWLTDLLGMSPNLDHFYWTTPSAGKQRIGVT